MKQPKIYSTKINVMPEVFTYTITPYLDSSDCLVVEDDAGNGLQLLSWEDIKKIYDYGVHKGYIELKENKEVMPDRHTNSKA